MKEKRIKQRVQKDKRIAGISSVLLFIVNTILLKAIKANSVNPTGKTYLGMLIFVLTVLANIFFLGMLVYTNTDSYVNKVYRKPVERKHRKDVKRATIV